MAGAARQPLLWLVTALTLAVVAASVWTIRRAGGPLATSPDAVRRVAQIQTTDTTRDRRALELGLRAVVEFNATGSIVRGDLPAQSATSELELRLIHATDAAQDRRLPLRACGLQAWCASEQPARARYRIELQPRDGRWRIVGARDPADVDVVALAPAWSSQ